MLVLFVSPLMEFRNFASAETMSSGLNSANIQYVLESFSGDMRELHRRFDSTQLSLLEKLNRTDLTHLARLRNIVVPSVWTGNELDYSPFPAHYPPAEGIPKILVVDIPSQAFGGYEYGKLIRWGPISSGRKSSPTPPGLFHLNWRSPGRHSTVNPEWYMRWYFNFDNKGGASLHQYELPGYPASHECIRLLEADARWLYGWGEEWRLDEKGWKVLKPGTPVMILNHYSYGSKPLWHSQEWLTHGIGLPKSPVFHSKDGGIDTNAD